VWSRILAKAAAPIRGYESPRHTKFKIVNGPSRARILLVEDEEKTARAIVSGLEAEGFAASWAETGEEGFFLLNSERFDALVLDWMLPGRTGLEVLKTLRTKDIKMPVLLLTARDALEDRIAGLDGGADDYLIKPFALAELAARLRALLRRATADSAIEEKKVQWQFSDLEVDLTERRVIRAGKVVDLTPREFDLLIQLLRNAGRIVSRETLAREVWQETRRATPIDNVIDVHIARLRRKIDDGYARRLIHTVRGVGFVLKEGATG
jgi:two-component system, OmpR family, copper resistance phosphate regulon response regulator CusR